MTSLRCRVISVHPQALQVDFNIGLFGLTGMTFCTSLLFGFALFYPADVAAECRSSDYANDEGYRESCQAF